MATASDAIAIDGLDQFTRNLKTLGNDLPKALRVAFNQAADIVVQDAKSKVPTKSGKARKSIKAKSTPKAVRLAGGSRSVAYYGWLDHGGMGGRGKKNARPFKKDGRYLYRAFYDNKEKLPELLEAALLEVARQSGVEID
jgi:hypothetical protein